MLFSTMLFANIIGGTTLVGGFGLGTTIYNSFCYAVIVALNNGLFTQAAHAYGAKNYRLVGLLL